MNDSDRAEYLEGACRPCVNDNPPPAQAGPSVKHNEQAPRNIDVPEELLSGLLAIC